MEYEEVEYEEVNSLPSRGARRASLRQLASVMGVTLLGCVLAGAATPRRVHISGNVQSSKCVHCPAPNYPPLARQAHVQGAVQLHIVIGVDGKVKTVQLVSGHPLLAMAAESAVRVWQYAPTRDASGPEEVETDVTVSFNP